MTWLADLLYLVTLIPHYLYHAWRTGKYGTDAPEKLGRVTPRTGEAPCLWLHAVSVGEVMAAKTVADAFRRAHPSWELVVSTATATGRAVAQAKFPDARVIYYPLDCSWMVRRTLDAIRPSMLVLMELEVWPNLSAMAAARSIPVVVVNARITERSVRGFKRWGWLLRPMLRRVRCWCSQNEMYTHRLIEVGVDPARIETVGSVKYDTIPTTIDPTLRATYRTLFGAEGETPLLVAGSTHPTEETVVLQAFSTLRATFPTLRLVLVPRHPERHAAVETEAAAVAPVTRRSGLLDGASASTPILLLDTMGELASVYAAADVVFVGGSLIPHGGQNIMEPCGLARPTLVGPSLHNFADAARILLDGGALRQVASAEEMVAVLRGWLENPAAAQRVGQTARRLLMEEQGATARTIHLLERIAHGD